MVPDYEMEEFNLKIDNVVAVVPCFKLVLYLDSTDDAGVSEFYQRSMDALGGLIGFYQAENMKTRVRLNERALTIVPTWLKRPREHKSYYVQFSGCSAEQGASAAMIELELNRRPAQFFTPEQEAVRRAKRKVLYEDMGCIFSPLATALRVTFPLDHKLADPDKLLAWVMDLSLVKEWPFLSGHCGYNLNHFEEVGSRIIREAMQSRLGSLCLRYPGFDWNSTGGVLAHLLRYDSATSDLIPNIKRVNWLTLVSHKAVEYLGGVSRLLNGLGQDLPIVSHPVSGGFVIQAGPAPQTGDIGARDFIPVYRRVAEVLRPVRLETIPGLGSGFSDDAAVEWLEAFDKDID